MKKIGKLAPVLAICLIFLLSVAACNPARWKHADIQQLDKDGKVVMTWEDCEILAADAGSVLNGKMIRFRKKDGKQVTITTDYNILYR